jgi:type 1 glutamine amidotransferase
MKLVRWITYINLLCLFAWYGCKEKQVTENPVPPNVLIYSKTQAYRHECIEPGRLALQSYFGKYGITTTLTEDSSVFSEAGLKPFDVVMFFQTTGHVLDSIQQVAFEKYIRSGKGFVGIHAAADTEYEWPWYGKLVGAYFANHPDIQSAALQKVDTSHISCKHLLDRWTRTDEWYNFKQPPSGVHVLLTIDEATYQGGTQGTNHPMSWYQMYDGGRSFYTALGHTVESYQDTMFLEHVRQGVVWAAGK